ncbi:MAG: penicillin-binding protein 1A [Rickettsiales bacterium]|nr:penicillin-binding protein 1A [Rickettsiales bacterium]
MNVRRTIRKKLKPKRKKAATKKRGQPTLESRKNTGEKRTKSDMPVYPKYRSGRKPVKKKKRTPWKRKLALSGMTLFALFFAWFSWGLPDIDKLNASTKTPSILIKTESGDIIGSFGDIYGDHLKFEDFPESLVDAVMATEDRNFYHHFGVDPIGLARAMFVNVQAGHVVQGGSTITQQLAKNVFLTPERSFTRKIKEVFLALKLEAHFSKKEIMSIYLNRVYLGAGNYGVDAAARRYFDKSARELTLSESAIIAGLLKAPSRFAPTSNPALSRERAMVVLSNMEDAEYLTKQQAEKAKEELARTMKGRKRNAQSMQYFSDWVLDQLPDYVGTIAEDLEVVTTISPEMQAMAEKAVTDIMNKDAEALKASQAALLALTPDGAVRAMIGGRDYAESQYNRATQSLRQPGSSFKLFVYLAGLEAGLRPGSMVEDQPIAIKVAGGTWRPKNYTNKYLGSISLREAVTESVNTVAVQVAQGAGLESVIDVARRLGISSELEPLPSIALGSTEVTLLELTDAYAHLAADGAIVYPYGIIEIRNTKGKVLFKRNASGKGVVLRPGVVHMMNDMLSSVVEEGTGRAARIGRPVAGKTGTTSDYRDAWFMGYTPDLVAGVWVGNDDNSPMKKVTGGMLPARIWHDFMISALANTPAHALPTATSDEGAALPWLGGEGPVDDGAEGKRGKELGPNFWDTLLR